MADFTYESLTVRLKQEEVWTIAWALLHDACNEHILRTHWSMHGTGPWEKSEQHKVDLARQFFRSIGREDIIDSRLSETKILLQKMCDDRAAERTVAGRTK